MLRGFGFVRVERQYYYIDWLLQVFAICTRVLVTLPLLRSLRKLCVAEAQLVVRPYASEIHGAA
jgi:hypothetical protein